MQTFQFTSPGVVATYQTVWTGDSEGDGFCYSYAYNGCCVNGIEMRVSHNNTLGGDPLVTTFTFGNINTCYREQSNVSANLGAFGTQRRMTMIELRIRNANLCPEGTLVDLKLTIDTAVICISFSCCNLSNDFREVI